MLCVGELLKVVFDDLGDLVVLRLFPYSFELFLQHLVAIFDVNEKLTGNQNQAKEKDMLNLLNNKILINKIRKFNYENNILT